MPGETMGQSPEIQRLLDTILPDGASANERADFARGLALLAELVDDVDAANRDVAAEGDRR